jgi:catechol 2,3-dioxygenase-like lactoylglutathione lyase family enzyme
MPELPRPAFDFPGAWFRLGDRQELHLIGGRVGPPATGHSQRGHFALLVDDIDAVASRLSRLGAHFSGPGPRPDGALQLFIMDPDGNLIEFCSNLPG